MTTTLQDTPDNSNNQSGKVVALSIGNKSYSIYLPNVDTDYIQKKISSENKPYELEMLEDIASQVSAGDLVLDIGANIGNHTLFLAAVAGCQVISFEPNAGLVEALSRSLELNGLLDRVSIVPYGVGRTSGKGHFSQVMEENLGGQSIKVGEGDLIIVALDELQLPDRVKLMKIDVEGMELPVLEGAVGLIEKDRPLIYVECMSAEEYKVISAWMEGHGYTYWSTFNATPTHLFLPTESVSLDMRLARLQHQEVLSDYRTTQQLETTRNSLINANQKYREACQRIDVLKEQLQNSDTKQQDTKNKLIQLQAELEDARQKADQRQLTYREACQQIDALKEQLQISDAKQHALDEEKQAFEADQARVQGLLEQALAEQQHLVARHAETSAKVRTDHEAELVALRRALDQQRADLESLTQELNKESDKRRLAEQRLIQTRASMTYQLGYQLKNANSLSGLVRLPISLASLYGRAKKQRQMRVRAPKTYEAQQPFINIPEQKPAKPESLEDAKESAALRPTRVATGQMKIACVMDDFTFGSYQPEAQLQQLTPLGWQAELGAFQPDLLFIESAWRGKDELWGSKVGHNASELQQIVRWCKGRGVPTLFWNKEDPVHFETFLTTAKQFDFVFTTDMDCIHRYKAALGHDRVFFLPFACQPSVHNPIELYERKDAFCFAGAYYARYPERTRDLGNFVSKLPEFRPVEIYDRNYGKNDPNYQFPAEYQPFIVGTLPFAEIDRAYKGYRYAINLNSIKQSQTMFARRVYELLGCNTVTVSNYSRGVRLMFGDLVITTDSGEEMVRRLQALAGDDEGSGKLRLAALRKVMLEHTYEQRLNYIVAKVSGVPASNPQPPHVAVLACAHSENDFASLLASFQRQTHKASSLYLVLGDNVKQPNLELPRVHYLPCKAIDGLQIADVIGDAQLLAGMVAEDYYGPNYLLDMAIATRYSSADAFGKVTRYQHAESDIGLVEPDRAYHKTDSLQLRCAVVRSHLFAEFDCTSWIQALTTSCYAEGSLLGIDPFNYCQGGTSAEQNLVTKKVDDLELDTGFTIEDLQTRAEAIPPAERSAVDIPEIPLHQLQDIFGPCKSKNVTFQMEEHGWLVTSTLEDGKHEYVYAAKDLTPAELGGKEQLKFFLDVTPGLNLQLVMLFLDAQKQRISHVIKHANRNKVVDAPPETAFIRLGWRVYQGGSTEIKGLLLGHKSLQPSEMLGRAEHLLVTNHYPSYQDLYRNGFVHSRVAAYRERGVNVDVFRLRKDDTAAYHEFENIDVTTGSQATLRNLLDTGRYRNVLVHFLDPEMWEVLKDYIEQMKIIVWVHGAEVQPWWRREYNYSTDAQLQIAKLESGKRMTFWRSLFTPIPENLKLIFVSRYFAEEVMEDVGTRVPEAQYEIIHNPINTDVFTYQEKPIEQRKKILSIRPYASPKYANDLSAKAIELLAEKPFFNQLEFRMIGDGPLFDEILDPLRKFPNVIIERGFLKQHEIAALHKDYGIFLCPTRMDAQGVSRDEAMASGLVPITNAVAAIPEFVDSTCGIVVNSEDAQGMAEGIEKLFENHVDFNTLSSSAAARVRTQSANSIIINREIEAITSADLTRN
jgi:FkbM family methyltransferase